MSNEPFDLAKEAQAQAARLFNFLAEANYKTPQQFADDWDYQLREVNRSVKKLWGELVGYGSIVIEQPGYKPIILLSPKAQDALKLFTPGGKATRDTYIAMAQGGGIDAP